MTYAGNFFVHNIEMALLVCSFPNLAEASGSGGILTGAGFLPHLKKNAGFRPELEPNSPDTALFINSVLCHAIMK